jgi:hypothetical protein
MELMNGILDEVCRSSPSGWIKGGNSVVCGVGEEVLARRILVLGADEDLKDVHGGWRLNCRIARRC